MPRSRSTVRIASTSSPENFAGCVTASQGARLRLKVLPLRLLLRTVRPRKRPRPASSTASSIDSPSSGMIGWATASITSRAVAPFWRASMKRPGTSIVRSTLGAAETSISVTMVMLACGATCGAIGTPIGELALAPLVAITRMRSPRSISRWSKPSSGERRRHAAAGRDHAQRLVRDGEDAPPVGLDHVGLVDPGLLHVGAGEVRHRATHGRSARRRRGHRRDRDEIAFGPLRHQRRRRDRLRRRGDGLRRHADSASGPQRPVSCVADEVLAGVERLQALLGTAAAAVSAASRAKTRETVAAIRMSPKYSA